MNGPLLNQCPELFTISFMKVPGSIHVSCSNSTIAPSMTTAVPEIISRDNETDRFTTLSTQGILFGNEETFLHIIFGIFGPLSVILVLCIIYFIINKSGDTHDDIPIYEHICERLVEDKYNTYVFMGAKEEIS